MAEALTIPNRPATQDITDITFLRETGIALLQKYSGNLWTDYNTHDPGVTILEVLCLALAEVGYRAGYDITELLGKQARPGDDTAFLPPQTVLPTAPVTSSDFRKLLLDISGVRNVRIRKSESAPEFNGLYDLDVQLTDDALDEQEIITKQIRETLDKHRQPGEEFVDIHFLEQAKIGFDLDLEVTRRVSSTEFFHSVANAIENYLSPAVHFSSEKELLEQRLNITEIYDGPMMTNGIVTNEMLEASRLRKTIYTSDLVNLLMKLPDVKSVRKIVLTDDSGKLYHWSYNIPANKVPRIKHDTTTITIRYKGVEISNRSLAHIRINRNMRSLPKPYQLKAAQTPEDNDRLREYYSINDDFPDTYGIGEYGLSGGATPQREALVHQLRGYLSIYDQLLAGTFEQLAAAPNLLSPVTIRRTYTPGNIRHLNGGEYLYKPFLDNYMAEYFNTEDRQHLQNEWMKYIKLNESVVKSLLHSYHENEALFQERRNRALNHLLARFGYDLSFFEYVAGFSDKELIRYKEKLLTTLPLNDRIRNVSETFRVNYLKDAPIPLSGFELRIALLAGIQATQKKSLANAVWSMFDGTGTGTNTIDVEIFAGHVEEAESLDPDEIKSDPFDPIDLLIETGGKREMYATEETETGTSVVLYGYDKDHPHARFVSTEKDELLIDKISKAIQEADVASEGFHFIDHIMMRPPAELRCFGFDVLIDGAPVFTCAPELTREGRDEVMRDFLVGAVKEENYFIRETAMRQFRVYHTVSSHIQGVAFYSSREEAQAAIREYVYLFSHEGGETIVPTSAFRDIFSDTDDPFSGIVTFVLPSWPSRFSNKAYRNYIEEVIARETPAQLVVNIRWFTFEKMQRFEDLFSTWLDSTQEAGVTPTVKKTTLNDLLLFLAD